MRHIENGFPVEYHSDIDGDRYIIIAPEDADMSGWSVEVGPDEAWYRRSLLGAVPDWCKPRIEKFTREHRWHRSGKGSPWGHLCYSGDETEYPWSALVDHGERIIRWIPPNSEQSATPVDVVSAEVGVREGVIVPVDSESSVDLDIVYTDSAPFLGALFSERETAKRAAQIWRAVTQSTTWGEFRKTMPADIWKEVVDLLDEDAPSDDTPISPDDVPGWGGDGYYLGPWPPEAVIDWFPEDLIDKYGGSITPNPNGANLELPVESADQIAADLRARGHTVEKSIDDLPEWISYAYR
jgi:hypothetical protein